jgi:hypothetical protein
MREKKKEFDAFIYMHIYILTTIEVFMMNTLRKKENARIIFRLKIHLIQFIFSSVTTLKLIAK